jgi:hypothetical protein
MTYPSVPTRVSSLPDGTALSHYLMVLGESRGDTHKALMIAERWRDTPQVKSHARPAVEGRGGAGHDQ